MSLCVVIAPLHHFHILSLIFNRSYLVWGLWAISVEFFSVFKVTQAKRKSKVTSKTEF